MRTTLLLFCIAVVWAKHSRAQNLLQNGGFETHGALDCINCPMFANKYRATIPPWENLNGSYTFICDCNLKKQAAAANDGICNFDKVSPHSGCNMMELDYMPSCMDQEHKTRGCSAYLGAKLAKPLEIGKVYEVSFWLHILPAPETDADYARFIGINLYPTMVRNPSGKLLEGNAFRLDTVVFGAWYPVKWLVRPLCKLQVLVFGVFADDERPPVNGIGHDNRFYIDDVAVKELVGTKADAAAIVPYCRYTAKEKAEIPDEIEGAECFFDSGDSLLLPEASRALDSFAVRAKASPSATFMIVGRTDSVGNQHKALANARIKSALDYLETRHGIPRFRFLQAGLGDESPLAENRSEAGRQLNRSVQIQQMDCPMHLMVYRYLLLDVFAGARTEAFKKLVVWINLAPANRLLYALFDPRLEPLKCDPRWKSIAFKKVRAIYQSQGKPALAFSLDSLSMEDQKCRTLDRYLENLHAYWAEIDSSDKRWEVDFDCTGVDSKADELRLKSLITLIGNSWPAISEVGKRPTKAAFLLLSHTADTSLIVQYLPLLKNNCEAGEAEWIHYATLSDRLLVHRGLPQRYGTQYRPPSSEADKLRLFPLENAAKVNEWRAELGLEAITIEEE